MRLDPRFTFERLVIGGANRLPAAAARAVAEAPGTTYNPLFIYGGSGLGKTHLLTATAHLLKQLQPQAEIVALSMDEFSEQICCCWTICSSSQGDARCRRNYCACSP